MSIKSFTLLISFLFTGNILLAQSLKITGKIIDNKDNSTLIGVSVVVYPLIDSTKQSGTVTDDQGNFELTNFTPGQYHLKALYLGYQTIEKNIIISGVDLSLGALKMKSSNNMLKSVTVEGKQIRATQLGDTTQFHADAFKTHPDATAEDLVTKMPGVTSDNSGVKVNGEAVQQVYVDGKPFFGTDPTLALKNLPAEVIDKIQVFDKLSDQSQFTGFDDGNAQKTMNIVTRRNKSNGTFGKVYGGYGTDDRYLAGGNLNIFEGDRRISILELSNNVNQQNFSSQDILGVTGGGQNRGGSGGGRGAFGGGNGGGGNSNNFLVGQQGGITTTHSVGLNYSHNWGTKIKVSGSYFFNSTDNLNNSQIVRSYLTKDSTHYYEYDSSESKNMNHRFNLRFEYTIDSFNSLIITPSISLQQNSAPTAQADTNYIAGLRTSNSQNRTNADYTGYSFSNNLLLQHKFKKRGRTVSLNVNTSLNEKSGTGSYNTLSDYLADTLTTTSKLDQRYTSYNNGYTVSPNITYTEPISKKGQLMLTYNPSYTKSRADKETDSANNTTGEYTNLDTLLSNKYNNTYITQRGGLSYRLGDKKLNFMIGANMQYATLQGNETFPLTYPLEKSFTNILPQAMFNYRYADGKNLRIMYRTNTVAPSISQLQNVIDISNPLLLKTGNANLKQDFEQTLTLRFGKTKAGNAHNFFVLLYANYINDYIGNTTLIPTHDSVYSQGITIKKGSQLTLPINLNGYLSTRMFFTYGLPAEFIKSNFNINGGINYTRTPGKINNSLSTSDSYAPTLGFVLSSNISEKVDFTLSYTGNYNILNNTIQNQSSNNYYSHTAGLKFNWLFYKGFVFNTNITHTYYSTLSTNTGNESFVMWNTYLGYKFFKNRSLEARITATDILNQNKSISRTVTELYIENSTTQVLKQYFMFSLTYT
ncbi:MAG: TonB-dependent receptor, partial [Bacteroidota bacterium]